MSMDEAFARATRGAYEIPQVDCGCCGAEAHAEFVDIGVGLQQVSPYHCSMCGATDEEAEAVTLPDGSTKWAWKRPPQPSERGETVMGYFIQPNGTVFETTFEIDHKRLCEMWNTTQWEIIGNGGFRITLLEGFHIDIPKFASAAARIAFKDVLNSMMLKYPGELPYVLVMGEYHGKEMPLEEIEALLKKLPFRKTGKENATQLEAEYMYAPGTAPVQSL